MRKDAAVLSSLALVTMAAAMVVDRAAWAGDWTNMGGDGGMSKYSPDNINAGPLQLQYDKRFYSKWANWSGSYANYNIACNVVIRNGVAVVQNYDVGNDDNYNMNIYGRMYTTIFDWQTGTTSARIQMRASNSGDYDYLTNQSMWFHAGELPNEIDSNHFKFPTVFGSDGRIYMRRGGDQRAMGALTLNSNNTNGTWTYLPADQPVVTRPTGWAGDAAAFINIYKDRLLFRPGDTRYQPYYASKDISASAWSSGAVSNGTGNVLYLANAAPRVIGTSGEYYEGIRSAGDIPKAAKDVAVIASWTYDTSTNTRKMYVTGSNVNTGAQLWTKNYDSYTPGSNGFYADASDTWQFVASEDGNYAMFNRPSASTPATIRMLDILSGNEKWNLPLSSDASPLMAEHNNFLYIVARNQQMKVNANTGSIVWQVNNSYTGDTPKYIDDPTYRPMVLTDDTLWFINNVSSGGDHLIGMRTSDGQVFTDLNVQTLVGTGETVVGVQDLVAADGKLALLLDVRLTGDTNVGGNGVKYQDLVVFQTPVPEPAAMAVVAVTAMGLLARRRKAM